MQKRSMTIAGHRTSLALEPEFWMVLEAMATARNLALPALVEIIDQSRRGPNLSSAMRVAALHWVQSGAAR